MGVYCIFCCCGYVVGFGVWEAMVRTGVDLAGTAGVDIITEQSERS